MFTIRQLRYFQALCETGHFGAAADKVGVSQPALSVQIAEMEKIVGAALFERATKKIILSPLGRNFQPFINDILARMSALSEIIADNDIPLNYPLKLGIIPTVAPYFLPFVLPKIAQLYPSLSLEIQETKTDRLSELLRIGELDVVIAADPLPFQDVISQELFTDHFYLAVPLSDPRIDHHSILESDIDGDRLLLLEEGHCLREQTLQVCKNKQYRHDITASSLTTLLQLVANNIGTTIIPQIAISTENKHNTVKILPFHSSSPKRNIKLFWRKQSQRNNDYKLFAKELRQIAEPILCAAKQHII